MPWRERCKVKRRSANPVGDSSWGSSRHSSTEVAWEARTATSTPPARRWAPRGRGRSGMRRAMACWVTSGILVEVEAMLIVPAIIAPFRTGTGTPRPEGEQRSEEHTSELQSRGHIVCRLVLEKKKQRVEVCDMIDNEGVEEQRHNPTEPENESKPRTKQNVRKRRERDADEQWEKQYT